MEDSRRASPLCRSAGLGRTRLFHRTLHSKLPAGFWAYFLTFLAQDGPLERVRPIPNAPERSWHASGPSFTPNGRFWTHFGPFLMFLARLENQVWAKTWPGTPNQACRFRNFFLGPIPELFFCDFYVAFPGNATNKSQKKVPEWGPEESSGICRPVWGFRVKLWPRPDFQVGPKTSKMIRNGSRIDRLA